MSMTTSYSNRNRAVKGKSKVSDYSAWNNVPVMRVGERIAARRSALGLSQTALAKLSGLSQATIGKLESGISSGSSHIHKIARALQTTPEYLSCETEDPSANFVPAPSHQAVAAEMGLVPLREVDIALGFGASYLDQEVDSTLHLFPRAWLDLYTRAPSDKLIITRGSGDSMVPTFFDQDLILIDTSDQTPRMTDQVWAISYCGLGSVKRLRPTPDGGWLLLSDNPTISPITAYDDEMHVLGRVCAYFRKV